MRHTPNRWRTRWFLALALAMPVMPATASEALREEAMAAEEAQAALQARIDAADEATRADIEALREARREVRQLSAYNRELAPRLDQQAATLDDREAALEALGDTREALPGLLRDLVERLRLWVEADLPFLKEERLARVESLQSLLTDGEVSHAEALERVLAAWRRELDYGRELDAWRGLRKMASTDSGSPERAGEPLPREVEFLRIGRAGLYYLTPDGQAGGVWKASAGAWQPLDSNERAEVDKGLRIARDQRAPALLSLPVSQSVPAGASRPEAKGAIDQRSDQEGGA